MDSITLTAVLSQLQSLANPTNVAGMARFGINPENTLGISVTQLREFARRIGKDHNLALELWDSGIHEARMLATLVDDPNQVTEEQMERWVSQVDSWDICDGLTGNLLDRTPYAYQKAVEWAGWQEEFVKRAGFALMAWLPVHDKKAPDEKYEQFFDPILRESNDDRNFVRKAVSWALRNIGKRSRYLNARAVETARKIQTLDSKSARWIASDALRELQSEKILSRIKR